MHCCSWPFTSIEHGNVLSLLCECRYAKIGPHHVGEKAVVKGLLRFSIWEWCSGDMNRLGWVDVVLGAEYLRLLYVLQVPVEGGCGDPSCRCGSPCHRLHGEYVREQTIFGVVSMLKDERGRKEIID